MQEVAHRVYIETRYPGPTLGLAILPRGMVLVDAPPCPDAAQSWQHTVRAMNGSVPDRVLVFLDAHPDRILGGQVMVGTQIMHEDAYRWLMENETTLLGREPQGAAWEQCPTAVTPEWPRHAITFTERMVLYLGDLPVLLHHKPGHRPGAVWVEVPHVRVLFVGDAVVLREPPFLAEADLPAWMRRLDELQEHYGDYVVIGGRDGVLNLPDALQTMRERLTIFSISKLASFTENPNPSKLFSMWLISDDLSRVLVGMQPQLRQTPPRCSRSMSAAESPSWLARIAAT